MRSEIIYCPHLDRDLRGILAKVPNPRIYTGLPTERGEDGCLESHKAIVRSAQLDEVSAVFVMEDDCEFTEHFCYDRWLRDARWAQEHGYDVLVGGCVQTYDPKVVRLNAQSSDSGCMIEVSAFHSAHCIVYFESAYSKIQQTVQPYDVSVGQVGCRVVMTYPFVAVQRPSYSGILRHDVNYVPLYQQYEMHLGRALGLRS